MQRGVSRNRAFGGRGSHECLSVSHPHESPHGNVTVRSEWEHVRSYGDFDLASCLHVPVTARYINERTQGRNDRVTTAAGYVVLLSKRRATLFQTSVRPSFAEAVPEFEHSRTSSLVCFVSSIPGQITHLAEGSRGMQAGTSQRRLNLTAITTLRGAVRIGELVHRVGRTVRRFVEPAFTEGGLLTGKSFDTVVDILSSLSPELRELLVRYSAARRDLIGSLSEGERWALASQKEAVNGALAIADIDRRPLLQWTPTQQGRSKSFLEGVQTARLSEDKMIWHDQLHALPGFNPVIRSVTGVARFENEKTVLEVIVADRDALEQQTGADLIYFNATYHSFVLVQYKVMEPNADGPEPGFRFPDEQLTAQLARMDDTLARIKVKESFAHRDHYRINANPFFLKLCPRIILDPDSVALTKGLYLPLGYWRSVEQDDDMTGPRGGSVVSYRNVRRYLDNTSFATMVRDAWIGTTPQQTEILGSLVEKILEQGRAAVIAVKADRELKSGKTARRL